MDRLRHAHHGLKCVMVTQKIFTKHICIGCFAVINTKHSSSILRLHQRGLRAAPDHQHMENDA